MRRVALALFSTVTGLVMLLSFKTHGATGLNRPVAAVATGPNTTGNPPTTASSSTPTTTSTTSAAAPKASSGTKTYTGALTDTQWGPVQVQITVTSGKLTKVDAVVYPWNNPRDQEINSYAIPALNQEALAAGSAQIDMISGATVTSGGYLTSLQSALDQAGL
jgi:uncharacterized protein with FMN-binding domain